MPAASLSAPNVKELHEEAVCKRFVTTYNRGHKTSYAFNTLQVPPAPDCQCSGNLNIEVVTAFYDEGGAKELFEAARGKAQPKQTETWIVEPDVKGNDAIDQCIIAKSKKKYMYTGKLFLVVDIRAPLLEWEDLERDYLAHPRGLPNGPFDEIWVLIGNIDGDHIGQVT